MKPWSPLSIGTGSGSFLPCDPSWNRPCCPSAPTDDDDDDDDDEDEDVSNTSVGLRPDLLMILVMPPPLRRGIKR